MKRKVAVSRRPIVQPISRRSLIEGLETRLLMSTSWQSVQIGGGGFVTGLAASSTGTAIYARTDVGGAYRWNGVSGQWMPITQSLPNDSSNSGPTSGIESIAVDPTNANRAFIAAGSYTYSNPSGIYVSADTTVANPTWTNIDPTIRVNGNGGTRSLGERLVVDPNNANVVYYGTNNVTNGGTGLRKYVYNGTTWAASTITTPAIGDTNLGITFVASDLNGGTVVVGGVTVSKYLYMGAYSATAGSGGVFASADGGQTWTKVTGVTFDKPNRGEVAADGTLYVNYNGGVAKLARASTTFTSVTPLASLNYVGLAVDPSAAGTVMVSETGSDRMWRSIDSGVTWVLMNRTLHNTDLDGTPSITRTGGGLQNTADILITPGNASEVWASDFLGVVRTDNIKNDTTASDWYNLQKNMEEVVPLALTSAPSGAPLLTGTADVNGFVHNNPDVRPLPVDKFETPTYISTTGLDFSEGTTGANTVWARVGDLFYTQGNDSDRTGGISINDGKDWASFGQLDNKSITNSATAGWETFDVGAYLAQQKAAGATSVTLVVRGGTWMSPNTQLTFSSRESANAPQVVVNGTTTITPTADGTVSGGATTTNYGNGTTLAAKNYYYQASNMRYSFLKFDLTTLSSITSATLRLYRLAAADTNVFSANIYASATTNWVEGDGGTDGLPAGELTWNNMPALYTPPAGATGGRVALSATNPAKIVWAAENGAVWYSDNRSVSWTRSTLSGAAFSLNTSTEFVPNQMNLASDRAAADTFYGYSTTGGGTVYRSTDGGATWSSLVAATGTGVQYKIEGVPGQSGQFWLMTQNYNVGATFKAWNGTALTSVTGISSVVDFSFGKSAPGRTNATVFVRKADGTYWYSVDATAGVTSTWTQMAAPALPNQTLEMEADRQTFGRIYVGTGGHGVFYADVSNNAIWDGGTTGAGTSWNAGVDWNPDALPLTYGTATFTDAGLSAGNVITLDANQTINQLTIGATTGFTIGSGSTYGLSLQNVDRQDIAGTEANQTIAAPVTLTGDSVWSVAGSGVLASAGGIAGAFTLTKQGAGELDLAATTYSGDTTVLAGTLKPTANGAIKGNLIVGGGATSAVYSGGALADSINNAKNVTVNANGAVTLGNGENISSLIVNGGTFNTTYSYVNGSITMTGGTIGGTGAIYGNHTSITTNASATTANINVANSLYSFGASNFTVGDGAAAIDLKVTGGLAGGSAGNNVNKTGAGLMMLTAASTQVSGTFAITNGTLLVNNTSGSGTGQSTVAVNATAANATLGGTGIVGGVTGYTNANVSLTGNSSFAANLSPGSVDPSAGTHVLGTLTVGSATQANNVTLNGYSRLNVAVNGAANDRLTVNGNLSINAANTTLAINVTGTPTLTSYTLASCTGTLTGSFATITGVPTGYQVVYGTNSITLVQSSSIVGKKKIAAVATSQTSRDTLKKHQAAFSNVQITATSL